MKFAGGCLAILLAFLAGSAQAQYASVDAGRAKSDAAAKSMLESLKGSRYWIVPNPKAISPYQFRELDEDGNPAEKKFVVTEPTSFIVHSYVYVEKEFRRYARIVFEDDKDAALELSYYLFESKPGPVTLFHNVFDPAGGPRMDFIEYVFTSPPKDIYLAEARQSALAIAFEAALIARGDVKIGMNAKQVRASGWGKPAGINKKSDATGTYEEWIYEGKRSLHFTNGRLNSVLR
jgi:hypothetical protein